jgi:penicillin amidase
MKKRIMPVIGVILVIIILIVGMFTPLMSILNPETGVPHNAKNLVIQNTTYTIPNLDQNVTIVEGQNGTFHIYATNNHDMFLALGFIQAKCRLFEMTLLKLTAMGQLSQMLGSGYNNYDKFQTLTGVPITAQKDWNTVASNQSTNATDALTVNALESYSDGINCYINYSESHNVLPFEFKLLDYKPGYWTPVDSYAIQEYMAQDLEFSDDALLYSLLDYKLGNNLTDSLIPVFSPIPQVYYGGYNGPVNQSVLSMAENTYSINSTVASMAFTLAKEWDPLDIFPPNPQDHSNEFVVAGNRTDTGSPMLVGGPVLAFTLPSIWFEVQLVDPEYDVSGVVLPGVPAVVIGHNQYTGWTLTDTQAISWGTFFFIQTIHGNKFLWNDTYYPLKEYNVNNMKVNWTNLGPIMLQDGNSALVMDWMGNKFSNDIGALLNIMKSENWIQFRTALEIWKAPYQNFAFADKNTVADISPAFYPIFGSVNKIPYNPSSIMPGNGTQFITGSIPYNMVPQVVNPEAGYVVSSNQRQVGPSYPYWFGNTMSFSAGYRAMLESDYLSSNDNVSINDLMNLQSHNYTDNEAQLDVPYLLNYMKDSNNSSVARAYDLLSSWDYNMSAGSEAASVWFFTYMDLFNNIFRPFLTEHGILPEYESVLNVSGMAGSYPNSTGIASLDIDISSIIISGNATPFSSYSLSSLVIKSAEESMNYLNSQYPDNYTWGHFYGFEFPSILGFSKLGVGPISRGGDYNTPNDASGVGPHNWPTGGQSFTMVLNLANISDSYSIYPGGQSENPASHLYSNYINEWINGRYNKMVFYDKSSDFSSRDIMAVITMRR